MSTEITNINQIPGGIDAVGFNIPANTEVTFTATTNSSKTQGVYFQWEFYPAPSWYGYTGSGENVQMFKKTFKTPPAGQGGDGGCIVQAWFWSVDSEGKASQSNVYYDPTSCKVTLNSNGTPPSKSPQTISTEDATDNDENDTVLKITW